MSKYAIITWTLSMATLAIVGAGYLYNNSNQSSADSLRGDVQTSITLDGPTTLAPPDPSDTPTGGTTTPTTTDTTTTTPTTTDTTPTTTPSDPTPTTTDTTPTTTPSDTGSATPTTTTTPDPSSSSATTTPTPDQTPSSTPSPSTSATNPSSTTNPTTTKPTADTSSTTDSTSVATINGTSIIKTATEIKQIITNSLVMHRTVSAERDAVKIQFTIPEANAPVTIAIQSDPIVVRTTSDKNGNVVYEVTDPLQPGNHTLTISITDPKDPAKIISVIKPFTLPAISTASDLNTSANLITKERIVIPIQYLFALVLSVLVTSAVSYAIYRHHSSRDTDLSLEG